MLNVQHVVLCDCNVKLYIPLYLMVCLPRDVSVRQILDTGLTMMHLSTHLSTNKFDH